MKKFNEWVALKGTIIFGSMWTAYVFFIYGFLPIIFKSAMDKMLYWSNTVQLWSLPLLMVGQNIQGRASEKRMIEMYNMVKEELDIAKEERQMIKDDLDIAKEERQELMNLVQYLHQKLENGGMNNGK